MTRSTRCFHCGGTDLETREVEEFLSEADSVVRLRVSAMVCLRCRERYFDPDTVRRFEEIRSRLRTGDLSGFRKAGELLEPVAKASKDHPIHGDNEQNPYSLRGLPIRYDDPTEPVAESHWGALDRIRADQRVRDVSFSTDSFTVELMDGRAITTRLLGFRACFMRLPNSARTGESAVRDTVSTGQTLTRTSRQRVFCAGLLHLAVHWWVPKRHSPVR